MRPQSEFPLLDRYKMVFDITDETIFAYGGIIYSNNPLPEHLIIHEIAHLRQQDEHGLDNWVSRYLSDPQFRLDMEVEAYRIQLASIKDRNLRHEVKVKSAKDLSSSLYGNIISSQEAYKLLTI